MASKMTLNRIAVLFTMTVILGSAMSLNSLSYRILEELVPSTIVGNIKADAGLSEEYEPNVLEQLRFGILPPDNDDVRSREYFSIEEVTGILRLSSVIDRDHERVCAFQNTCSMTFDVVVSPPQYFRVINIQVEILDVNDNAPEFSQNEYKLNISESALPGTMYNLPSVFDPDSTDFGINSFEIRPSTSQFKVTWSQDLQGDTQPQLNLLEQLDREDVETFDISVVAFDSQSPPNSAALLVHVTVLDTNDNSPEFDLPVYESTINENTDVGTPVLSVHAEDPDVGPGGTVRYSLSAQTLGESITKFRVDPVSGVIYLAEAVDREEQELYVMQVIAKDMTKDGRQTSATVTVYVDDVNDNAPVIRISVITSSGRAEVSEAADVGTFVALVSVTDSDWGQNSEVICRLSSYRFGMQVMQPNSKFKIVTESRLDREDQEEYQVSVSCEDKGVPTRSSRETFSVHVTDTNDHSPVFSRTEYDASVIENSPVGSDVIQVQAADADIGDNSKVAYSLLDDGNRRFIIEVDSGLIRTNSQLDYEESSEMRLVVVSRDQGQPSLSSTSVVVVHIMDVNDLPPVFRDIAYTFVVKENQMTNSRIGQVSATDKDSGDYSKFFYSIRADVLATLNYFAIDPDNGTVTLLQPLDRETQSVYHLTVVAMDTAPPALSGTASLTVYVDDINDNAPIVDFPSYQNNTAVISNRLPPGYKVTQIRAHDLDTGVNAELSYFVVHDKNESQQFGVDPKSGEVFLNHDVSKVKVERYYVDVLVKDNGIPGRSTHANLTIVVNQSAPILAQRPEVTPTNDNSGNKNMLIIIIVVATSGVIIIVLLASIVFVLWTSRKKGTNESKTTASVIMNAMETDSNYGDKNGNGKVEHTGKEENKHDGVTLHMEKDHQRYVSFNNRPSGDLNTNASGGEQVPPRNAGYGNTSPMPPSGVFVSNQIKNPDVDTSFISDESDQTRRELMSLTGAQPVSPRRQPVEEVDRASASTEGSVTDSGRGGSEEGETGEDHGPPRRPPKQPLIASFRRPPPAPGYSSPYYNSGSSSQQLPHQPNRHSYPRHNSHSSGQGHSSEEGHIPRQGHTVEQGHNNQAAYNPVNRCVRGQGRHPEPHSSSPQQTELILGPDYGLSQLQTEFDPHYRLKYSDMHNGPGCNQTNNTLLNNGQVSNINSQGNNPPNKQTVRNVKAKDKHKKADYVTSGNNNSSRLSLPNIGEERSASANNLTGNSFSNSNSLLKYKSQGGSTCSDLTDATSMTSATSGSYTIDHDDDRGLGHLTHNIAMSSC